MHALENLERIHQSPSIQRYPLYVFFLMMEQKKTLFLLKVHGLSALNVHEERATPPLHHTSLMTTPPN